METLTQLPITYHTAEVRLGNPRVLLLGLFTDIARSRHISWEMMKRDLKSQYRTSILGVLIPLLPALTTAAWAILFRDAHLINVGAVNMPYPFFVLCGMMLWAAFLESMDAPISGVLAEQSLLSKADVPAESVTLARLGLVFFNFGVKCIVIVAAALFYRVHVPWTIVLAPFGFVLIVALGAAIGLILAPINLLYTDVARAIPVVTTFWFFTTPIIFTTPSQGWAAVIMRDLNPVTPLLTTTRELAFGSGLSMPAGLEITAVLTLCLLAIGLVFHRIAMPIVIDRAQRLSIEPMPTLEQIPAEILETSQPAPEPAWLVDVQGVRKKYCRDLRRSLWYGIRDVAGALTMRAPKLDHLRESEFWAVDNISFQLRRGDALGLLGRNGAGKSTLLKLITGQRSLTAGTIATRGRMVALTELGLGFNLALTGRENAYVNAAVHGLTRAQCDAIIEDIIDFSGIREFIDSAVQTYSSGMRARLGFSVATHLKPDILVVDEVLAVGDLDFKRKCIRHILKYLREGGSVILVAHDPYLVQSMCNRCIVMERGKVIFEGSGVEGVNFHFQLGHSKQYATLLDAAERVLGDTVAEAEAEAAQDSGGKRRSRIALTQERPIVLDDIEVASLDGSPIHTGRPLKVMLHYRSSVDADVTCGFSIRSSDMQTSIASFPRGLDGNPSHVHVGEGSIVAVLPELPLQPGVYAVRGGIGDADSLTGITIKGYEDSPHFFTVVAHDVSRSANYKVIHGDLIACKVEWIS